MRQRTGFLHELPYTEMVKSGTSDSPLDFTISVCGSSCKKILFTRQMGRQEMDGERYCKERDWPKKERITWTDGHGCGQLDSPQISFSGYYKWCCYINLLEKLPEAGLIVPDFTIYLYSSSCNSPFMVSFSLLFFLHFYLGIPCCIEDETTYIGREGKGARIRPKNR